MSTAVTAPILVLHAPGDPAGGRDWRDALATAGWSGPIVAPDLPGHGDVPPPPGGNHELADAAFAAVPALADAGLGDARPVVVGVGANGWAAQLLALAGRAAGLVLVDGLGSPWFDVADGVLLDRAIMRAVADDPVALAPHTGGGLDPRLVHGPVPHGSRRLAVRAAAAIDSPSLLLESRASATSDGDVAEIAALFPAGADVVRIGSADPTAVSVTIVTWAWDRKQEMTR